MDGRLTKEGGECLKRVFMEVIAWARVILLRTMSHNIILQPGGGGFEQVRHMYTHICIYWTQSNGDVIHNAAVSHRDESACGFGEGNLSSSFRMALMSGTAGSWGDRFASELMNSVCRTGRWNGPALRGRGRNIDWSEPAHASPGDSAQHELAAVAAASSSSSADVLGRPEGWPPEVAEDLHTYGIHILIV